MRTCRHGWAIDDSCPAESEGQDATAGDVNGDGLADLMLGFALTGTSPRFACTCSELTRLGDWYSLRN